jgi:hypothetical protein
MEIFVKIYSRTGIKAAKTLAILLCSVISGCDIWNKPLTQPIIDQLNATHTIELKRHPSYFFKGDTELADGGWKNESNLEVIGTKGNLETWIIPLDMLTIDDINSKTTKEPQTIKVSYHDAYNGELSEEFRIIIFEAGAKLYKIEPDADHWLVPFPSLAEEGGKIEVFARQPDSHFLNPYSLGYILEDEGTMHINDITDRSADGGFVFSMPARDIELKADFHEIGPYGAFNVKTNERCFTLEEAVSGAVNGETIIILKPEIDIGGGSITIDNKNITLQSLDGAAKTIKRGNNNPNSLFTVKKGGNLTLDSGYSGGLIIDGNNTSAIKPLIAVEGGGTLIMGAGSNGAGTLVTLKNNHTTSEGGGVHIDNGVFTMYGGTISGNKATSAESHGGGVYAKNGAVVNIHGGLISGNYASYGGGIQCGKNESYNAASKAVVNINGYVTVIDNTGTKGAGLNIDNGELTMLAGIVTDNTATAWGGGVHINYGGTFTLKGGRVKDNKHGTQSFGKDVYVENGSGTFHKSGGVADDVYSPLP